MGFTRRRSDRPDSARRRQHLTPEILESRQLLSTGIPGALSPWVPSDLFVTNPVTKQRIPFSINKLVQRGNPDSPLLNNAGKIVSGKDRQGDEWTITVHGPGYVIVNDTTPNDGSLDDDIATIQLVNTDPRRTYVTGNITASARDLTDGTVKFNRLISTTGVHAIDLNGFDLDRNVSPAVPQTETTGVFLDGGVTRLSFHDIIAPIDTATDNTPYQIVIGDPSTPLKVKPSIYLYSIYNSVFDSTAETIPTGPVTTPSVQFSVNGVLQNFSIVSATQAPVPAAFQFQFNIVGTTGRTSVQALAVDHLNVRGSAKNFTVQRGTTPFESSLSGLNYLRHAQFGGVADAVALDVNGPIQNLRFRRGLGDPTGVFNNKVTVPNTPVGQTPQTQLLPATSYGVPEGTTGYPAAGMLGGVVQAKRIRHLQVGPANQQLQTAQNPDFVQLHRQGSTTYFANPGNALTNVAVTSSGSINGVQIVGSQVNSEIKSGFNYPSYLAGLEGTRAASRISRLHQRGDMTNGVTSASYRPKNNTYNLETGTAGAGAIQGKFAGRLYNTGGRTALGNFGAGFFARLRSRNLPPLV